MYQSCHGRAGHRGLGSQQLPHVFLPHVGQVAARANQKSKHVRVWNTCMQGSHRTTSPAAPSSLHMTHCRSAPVRAPRPAGPTRREHPVRHPARHAPQPGTPPRLRPGRQQRGATEALIRRRRPAGGLRGARWGERPDRGGPRGAPTASAHTPGASKDAARRTT